MNEDPTPCARDDTNVLARIRGDDVADVSRRMLARVGAGIRSRSFVRSTARECALRAASSTTADGTACSGHATAPYGSSRGLRAGCFPYPVESGPGAS